MGTVTTAITHKTVWGDKDVAFGLITMSNSYAAGGDTITAALLGVKSIGFVMLGGAPGGYVFHYNPTNVEIEAYEAGADGAALDEVAATTDLSAIGGIPFIAISG